MAEHEKSDIERILSAIQSAAQDGNMLMVSSRDVLTLQGFLEAKTHSLTDEEKEAVREAYRDMDMQCLPGAKRLRAVFSYLFDAAT